MLGTSEHQPPRNIKNKCFRAFGYTNTTVMSQDSVISQTVKEKLCSKVAQFFFFL